MNLMFGFEETGGRNFGCTHLMFDFVVIAIADWTHPSQI